MLLTVGIISTASITVSAANDKKEIPAYMKPDSVIVYNEDLTYDFEAGGETEDFSNEEATGILPRAGVKVVYDKRGLLKTIYYPVPGSPDEYQLKDPFSSRLNSGVRSRNSGSFPHGKSSGIGKCTLTYGPSNITGTGQITFYGYPDHGKQEAGDHNIPGTNKPYMLKQGDCATKIKVDDVPTGTVVTATNTKNGKTMKFSKQDVGTLTYAILDIYEDGSWSKKGICGLTVNGVKDSVDNGKMSHNY